MTGRWNHRLYSGLVALGILFTVSVPNPVSADTLDEVRNRGHLLCGVTSNSPPFSTIDDNGERVGFDIDNCKAVSIAVFGNISIKFLPLTPHTAFMSLLAGEVDLFSGGSTWTFTRDAMLGLDFTGIYFYDGQGFLVHRDLSINGIADLNGATICVSQGTTSELNLADYFNSRSLSYNSVTFSNTEHGINAYRTRRCDAYTTDRSVLAVWMMRFEDRNDHLLLSEMISKEPFAPVVRQGDGRWRDIVTWALNIRVLAEALGINQANVSQRREHSENAEVQRLFGVNGNFGENLGLSSDWAYDIIRLVGNYHDVWARHFGSIGIKRGVNAPWTEGGLLFGLPMR